MEYFAAIAFFLALSAPTNADGSLGGLVYAPGHASVDYYTYPRYAFEYAVRDPHTGDNKAQWEKRDGDVVIGAYSLVEPDGSLRVVEYRADDKTGFNAVVKRIGPNIHPVATPIYKASIPSLGYKSYLPHLIGPVAGLEKLASAPLYNGVYSGSASPGLPYKSIAPAIIKEAAAIPLIGKISEASVSAPAPLYNTEILPEPIYREPTLPIYKVPISQVPLSGLPILPPPISKQAPLLREPIYPSYLGRSGLGLPTVKNLDLNKVPIPQVPIYKTPILQESYGLPILPPPISKQAPLLREPLYSSYLGRGGLGLPTVKNLDLNKVPIPQVPIYKTPILQESYGLPILPPPISKQAPLLREPIYSSYLGRGGLGLPTVKNLDLNKVPIPQVPIYKAPLLQQSYGLPILPPPILRREPIYYSYLGRSELGLPAVKNLEPIALGGIDYNLLGKRLLEYRRLIDNRAALGYKGNLENNAPLVYKGYAGP